MVTRAKPSGAPSVAPVSGHAALLLLQPPPEWELTDERFVELCELNPGLRFEIDERGRLSIRGGAGFRSSSRALRIGSQVDAWVLAGGVSCRHQIADGAGRSTLTLAQALEVSLGGAR